MEVDTWIAPWDLPPAQENFAFSPPFGPSFGSAVGELVIETKSFSAEVLMDETQKYLVPKVDFGGVGPSNLKVSFDENTFGSFTYFIFLFNCV